MFELVRSEPRFLEQMLREHVLMPVAGLDIEVGIHPFILDLLAAAQWGRAKRSCQDLQDEFRQVGYQADGIRVVAGQSWRLPFAEFYEPSRPL